LEGNSKVSEQIEIRVPDIGDFDEVPVIELLVSAGDTVAAEQSLITLESDKATMEVPSPAAGTLVELKVDLDDKVKEGDVLALLEISDSTDAKADDPPPDEVKAPPPPKREPAEKPVPAEVASEKAAPRMSPPVPIGSDSVMPGRVPYASPAIRAFARELGVDLLRVEGKGRNGRILREDVSAFVKVTLAGEAVKPAAGGVGFDLPPPPKVDFSKYGDVERAPLSRIQKISGGYLHRNWVSIPHVTQHDDADITDMESFRKANAEEAIAQGFKLTPLVFMIKASVAALKKFPQFNSSLEPDGENLILKHYFHIGIAVDTPGGLVVPVVRDCDRKGIMELAAELAELSARAREGKLKPTEMQGGCFTISSLGGIGGTSFTPIINAPEVAILGVSRSRMSPVWNGKKFIGRLMLPLSLSYDHRVIDGANGARFLRYLSERLEDLRRLTL
jgi:pyruvate dehydrogenase E2 component (dihydrolipoamide acetyltransferase)